MSLPQPFNLDGKVAVVTGAASGLGIAFAEAMAEAGADVVCADINEDALEETADKVEQLGQNALAVRCDVSKEDDVKAMVEKPSNISGGSTSSSTTLASPTRSLYRCMNSRPMTGAGSSRWTSTACSSVPGKP